MDTADVINIVQQQLAQLLKVRIPELPDYGLNGDKLTLDDRLPICRVSDNKTVQTTLEEIKALLVNSSDEVLTPTLMGSIFVVTAGASENESDTFNIPVLANKEFVLRPAGFRALKVGEEYEILASGGFKLLTREMVEGEEFEIELIDDSIPVTPGDTSGTTIFKGAVPVSSSLTINFTNYGNKLIQLRPQAAGMVTSLPNVEDVPENTVWLIEASLALFESKIGTTAGQYIYFNGSSTQEIYLRAGNYLGVYRGADGWYVWTFDPRIVEVGKQVLWGYTVEDDEVVLEGGNIARSLYPRFAKKVDTEFAASKVTLAEWNLTAIYRYNNAWTTTQPPSGASYITVPFPFRGCFADVDANTIRLPDYRNSTIRGLGADGTQRYFNQPGGFQNDQVGEINYELHLPRGDNFNGGNNSGRLGKGLDANVSPDQVIQMQINAGQETRMKNIGLKAKMKV